MTKRLGYIITEENVTEELCKAAIKCAAKKKTKRYSVRRVLKNLDCYAKKLRWLILDGTYEPSPYKECHIIDRGSKKHRVLHKPKFFPDQCVHHVAIKLIEPRVRARLDTYAIASIKGIRLRSERVRCCRLSARLNGMPLKILKKNISKVLAERS